MVENKNTRAMFELPSLVLTPHHLLRLYLQKQNQIAGVFNPHYILQGKIAISNPANINISRGVSCVRLGLVISTICLTSPNFSWITKP